MIIFTHHSGEPYGILGAQMAATFLEQKLSIPSIIIHHASYLGDWIRQIESTTDVTFSRQGTWIEWWNPSLRK